jgi:hypothetical protein
VDSCSIRAVYGGDKTGLRDDLLAIVAQEVEATG